MLYAVIDIGSTTIRMAIYEILDNKLNLIHKRKYTVGLASYVKDNVMEQAGIDKACEILNSFKSFLTSFNIENVSAFTTAALRNAQNSKELSLKSLLALVLICISSLVMKKQLMILSLLHMNLIIMMVLSLISAVLVQNSFVLLITKSCKN